MYTIAKYKNAGCASSFYTLKNSKRGFKTFENEEAATIAHHNQKRLAEYDLAPRVYSDVGRVRVGEGKKLSKWGYITEMADTIGCGGNSCSCCDRDELECEMEDDINELVGKIEEIGFYFGDCHSGNVGYVKRGSRWVLVCIDTGDESVTSDECYCLICKKGGNCCG